ncbi:TetR/AcrR family transcriptional regulator [Kribbella sp. GL6]|uniref:TetR/AcrR family transcriptional regulator n=1 Tax=Kribbella sp. GL6 TaxID=3419765 RepID=UPI003D0237D0
MADRPLRADARRNRDRILEVARAVFAADGPGVSLDDLARRAGVGPGTLHRHFPTKAALIAAVIGDRLTGLAEIAEGSATAADPAEAFFGFLERVVADSARNLALAAALGDGEQAEPGRARGALTAAVEGPAERVYAAFAALLTRAQGAGEVRSDVAADELHAIVSGVLVMEQALPERSRGRGMSILVAGLRTSAPGSAAH